MSTFNWLSALFRKPVTEPQSPSSNVEQALSVLAEAGVPDVTFSSVKRFAVSKDSKYCGLTMNNYESYAVDTEARRYLHYPTAGVTGFIGSSLVLSPDEERFSLEPSGHEPFEVDLQSELLPWASKTHE